MSWLNQTIIQEREGMKGAGQGVIPGFTPEHYGVFLIWTVLPWGWDGTDFFLPDKRWKRKKEGKENQSIMLGDLWSDQNNQNLPELKQLPEDAVFFLPQHGYRGVLVSSCHFSVLLATQQILSPFRQQGKCNPGGGGSSRLESRLLWRRSGLKSPWRVRMGAGQCRAGHS